MNISVLGHSEAVPPRFTATSKRIFVFSLLTAGVAGLLAFRLEHLSAQSSGYFDGWWGLGLLSLLFGCSELMVVHLQVGRSAHTLSVVEVTMVVALFNASPRIGLIAHLIGSAFVLIVHRRQRLAKLFFNFAMFALENQLAYVIFRSISVSLNRSESMTGGSGNRYGPMPGLTSWPAAYLGAGVFTLAGVVLVFGVIYLAEQELSLSKLRETVRISLLNTAIMASVGITASALLATSPATSVLLLVPIVGAYMTNKTFLRERRRIEDLEFLKESSLQLTGEAVAEDALWGVLEAARAEFRVEAIDYEYREGVGLPWRRVSLRRDQPPLVETLTEAVLASHAPAVAVLVNTTHSGHPAEVFNPLRQEIASRNLGSLVMVAPVRVANEIEGVLLIAHPSTSVVSFGQSDLRLAEMLASQLASATETGRLGQSVAELRRLESRLVFEMQHDALTGILNRSAFVRHIREAIVSERRVSAVLFLDLDDFKPINDIYGHAVGDRLLQALATRIQSSIRPQDLACRLGGDEFAVFLSGIGSPEEANAASERILSAIGQSFELEGGELVNPAASIGLALTSQNETAESAIERADAAMFRAKHHGKGRIELCDPTVNQRAAREAYDLALEFSGAASRGELDMVFQSVHRLDAEVGHSANALTDRVIGVDSYEVLVRWNHPKLGMLSPDRFMPTGLHVNVQRELRRFVSNGAVNALEVLRSLGFVGGLSVNLAAGQALDDTLLEDIDGLLSRDGIEPARLRVEIAETAFLRSSATMLRRVAELQAAGAGIVLDDLSLDKLSVGMIETLRPNQVKLSRTLVSELGNRPGANPFVRAVADLGLAVGYEVVAKGVEDEVVADRARSVGCLLGQGYYFARPMTLAALAEKTYNSTSVR
jgi:diguanylate cyclase (GGDEF)-like protein